MKAHKSPKIKNLSALIESGPIMNLNIDCVIIYFICRSYEKISEVKCVILMFNDF